MSSIVIAGGLILFFIIIILALVSTNNNQRKKKAMELVDRFDELRKRNNLSFTQKEMMENFIIGLDELRMKLFVLSKTGNKHDFQLIDLKEVKSCSKKKIYKTINMGTTKKEKYESHIDKIVLEFDMVSNRVPIQVPFYEAGGDHLFDMPELERKAGSWAAILTKTLTIKLKSTA